MEISRADEAYQEIVIPNGILADPGAGEAFGLLLPGEEFDILAQPSLVAFQGQHIIGLLTDDGLRDVTLASYAGIPTA